jgi:head-tail adaptor
MRASELNTRVTIKQYQSTQDGITGTVSAALQSSWQKWAKVTQRSGSRALDSAAINYREVWEIIIRYEVSRPTSANYNIEYNGREMKIHSVTRQDEGFAWYETITAYK